MIQPVFFDLQVNGYFGVDFNVEDLSPQDIHAACDALRNDGIEGCLATIITEDLDRMAGRLRRIVELRNRDSLLKNVIAGIHIEGPFISPMDGYRGAHPKDGVIKPSIDAAQKLLDAAGGLTRILTLAPEHDESLGVIKFLARSGVKVSAGHCNPTLDQLKAAIDAGLSMFTHVGNGCPMLMHRHDNIVQRVLCQADRLWLMFIADGVHVPFVALRNYLKLAGVDRCIVVTDCMAAAGKGPGRYHLGRWDMLVDENLVAMAPDKSHLLGSAMTMPRAAENLVKHLGLTQQQVRLLTYDNPRKAVGI